jgi:hypothetical protein
LSAQLSASSNNYGGMLVTSSNASNVGVPLLARVYLKLGTWKRALSPGLDDSSIQGKESSDFFFSFLLFFLVPYIDQLV